MEGVICRAVGNFLKKAYGWSLGKKSAAEGDEEALHLAEAEAAAAIISSLNWGFSTQYQ